MILWPDGFNHYGTDTSKMDQYATVGARWAPSTVKPRTESYSMEYKTAGGSNSSITTSVAFRRTFPTAQTVIKIGYAFWISSLPSIETDFAGLEAVVLASFLTPTGHTQVHIVMGTDGSIAAYGDYLWGLNGGLGTLLGRSDPCIHITSWNHFEVRAEIDAATGSIEVRIDGVTRLSLSSVNTDPYGDGNVTQVIISGGGSLNAVQRWYIADLIASNGDGSNADFLGDQQVFTDFPDGDVSGEQWIPSAGTTIFGVLDDPAPDDAGTYAEADNPGDVMGVTFPDLPATVIEVLDVTIFHRTKKTGPGASTVQTTVDSNGNQVAGEDRPMVTVYQGWLDNWDTDPDGNVPWTPANAGAVTVYVERTA